jgi:hypothetical protein
MGFLVKPWKEGLHQQHGVKVLANFQAGTLFIGEALVKREAQGLEEGL